MPSRRRALVNVVHPLRSYPMTMRDASPAALAARCPTAKPSHLRVQTGFVDEHKAFGIEIGLAVEPRPSPLQDVRTVLLQRMCGPSLRSI